MLKFSKYLILFLSLLILTSQLVLSENTSGILYSVNPSSPGWKNLTFQERRDAMFIPEDILNEMSTDEILQAWINMPMRGDILTYNEIQKGFEKSVIQYNVLSHLMNRGDAGKTILNRYISHDPELIFKNLEQNKRGHIKIEFAYIEILISQEVILKKLSTHEKRILANCVCTNHLKKLVINNNRNSFWTMTGMVLLSRLLEHEKYPEFVNILSSHSLVKNNLDKGMFLSGYDSITNNDIVDIALDYLSQ